MKLLFISYYLPPLLYPQSIQIGRFLNYLKKYDDLEIVVLTADEQSNTDKELYPDVFEGLEVIKVENSFNMYVNYIKNRFLPFIYQKPDSFKSWMDKAYRKITSIHQDFDIVLTFAYPLSTNLLGLNLKKFYDSKWIAHNSDPWADSPYLHIPNYLKNFHQKLEKRCFEGADKLLFTSLETAEFYKNKYQSLDIDFINHSFDKNSFDKSSTENKKFTFRYIGSFYGKRTPNPLFEALKLMPKEVLDKFNIELIGGGKKVELMLQSYDLDNIQVVAPVSYRKSLELMKDSDYLLVIDAPSIEKSIFFPSKLADYIGSEVPIFGISPKGSTNRILTSLGYKCIDTDDIEGIKHGILNCLKTRFVSKNIEQYNIDYNIKKLKRMIDE